jgi:hypothetical protein
MRFLDPSLFIDHVRDPPRQLVLDRIGRAVRHRDRSRAVGNQRKGKAVLFSEATARFRSVEAAADDLRVQRLVFIVMVPEPGPLFRSPRGIGLREEPEDHLLSSQILQPERFSAMIEQIEFRCFVSRIEHRSSLSDDRPVQIANHSRDCHAVDCKPIRPGAWGSLSFAARIEAVEPK